MSMFLLLCYSPAYTYNHVSPIKKQIPKMFEQIYATVKTGYSLFAMKLVTLFSFVNIYFHRNKVASIIYNMLSVNASVSYLTYVLSDLNSLLSEFHNLVIFRF